MNTKNIHVILKWNEAEIFHNEAPDTIAVHREVLNKYNSDDKYVWWGKISVSGYLGFKKEDVDLINEQINNDVPTYIFLYCPDKQFPTMHVGNLAGITEKNMASDNHTPAYYQDLREKYPIPYWFKITDIIEVSLRQTLEIINYLNGTRFDPVRVNFYPQKILIEGDEIQFKKSLEGRMMRCFKTGGICTRQDKIKYSENQMFIGCPFQTKYFNLVDFVLKPICSEAGYSTWIANEAFENIDIMCKVCSGIQGSSKAIIDITTWNANVLFELGLLYGMGKNVLLIKHNSDEVPVDLRGIEYVVYDIEDFNKSKRLISQYLKEV